MGELIALPETGWQWIQVAGLFSWAVFTWYLIVQKGKFKEGVGPSSLVAVIGFALLGNFITSDFQNDGILLYVKWRYTKEAWRNGSWQMEIPLTLVGILIYIMIAWPGALFG